MWYRSVPHRAYGTVGYHVKGAEWRQRPTRSGPRRDTAGAPPHPRCGLRGVHRGRVRRDHHERDRQAGAGLEARALRGGGQQAADARGLHPGAFPAAAAARRPARAARPRHARAAPGQRRHAAPPRDDAGDGHRRLPAGDRRSGARSRGRRRAGFPRSPHRSRRTDDDHDAGADPRTARRPAAGAGRAVRRAALGRPDDEPAAARRRAAEPRGISPGGPPARQSHSCGCTPNPARASRPSGGCRRRTARRRAPRRACGSPSARSSRSRGPRGRGTRRT